MKSSRLFAAVASAFAAAVLFAGCEGITHEPQVDMSALAAVDDNAFFDALNGIGIGKTDVDIMSDTSFTFADDDREFAVIISLDATSAKDNQYSYTRCVDEATAKALFDYYYDNYDHIFDAKEFSGISSHEVNENSAYVLIYGRYDDKTTDSYTPYHDAVYLKGDTVITVIASDYELSVEKEINDFLNALGYPHP